MEVTDNSRWPGGETQSVVNRSSGREESAARGIKQPPHPFRKGRFVGLFESLP